MYYNGGDSDAGGSVVQRKREPYSWGMSEITSRVGGRRGVGLGEGGTDDKELVAAGGTAHQCPQMQSWRAPLPYARGADVMLAGCWC